MRANQASGEGSIIWLASYPKSGSTWLRSLLTAYCFPDEPLDLDRLIGGSLLLDRQALDDEAGISSAHLTSQELIPYQAQWHRSTSAQGDATQFVKTHSAYCVSGKGTPLFPADASRGAICIVRNPLDVVPSLTHHEGRDFDWTVSRMADPDAALDQWEGRVSTALPQHMSSWSKHAQSWLDQDEIPLLLIRYEDLHRDTQRCLEDVLRFCAIDVDPAMISHAIDACRLERLQARERKYGFKEGPSASRPFFRSGKTGEGQDVLSAAQRKTVLTDHAPMMERLGYRLQ